MNKKILNASTIGIMLTILISIFPLTQILLLTLNGGLTYLFAIPFDTNKIETINITSLIVNSVLVFVGLIYYYLTQKTWVKIFSVFLIMFAGQMLMLFVSDEFEHGDNYLLGWLILSAVPTLAVLTIAFIKYLSQDARPTEGITM
jgi:hypothetical protein